MAYGFQQLDAAGNVLVDSSSPFRRLTQVWDQQRITLGVPNNTTHDNWKNIYLPLVTSQSDLENNYIIERTSGNSLNLFVQREETHVFTYTGTPNYVTVTFNGTCYNFSTNATVTCANTVAQAQTFNAYVIGKTFAAS